MVTFFADGNSIGTGTLGANGQATVSTAALTVGSHIITTTYGGDINFNGSNGTLNANQQVINAIGGTATTTTLMSSQNPSSIGQSVTFTATV
jgi:large repetitive protein